MIKKIALPKKIFSPRAVLECGQVFRYASFELPACAGRPLTKPAKAQGESAIWEIVSGDKMCVVAENKSEAVIYADENDIPYFENYFDLETDYEKIIRRLRRVSAEGSPAFDIKPALAKGKGLRLLRQDKFETLISFIISTNNNIPRIRGIIEKLCSALGEKRLAVQADGLFAEAGEKTFSAFPAPETMAAQSGMFYRSIGCGYRAPWLASAAKKVSAGKINLDEIGTLPTQELLAALRSFDGIGQKAADCIALFAYRRFDVFPVDTWVKKIYADIFSCPAGRAVSEKVIRERLVSRFGEYAGAAQQFLFYHYRLPTR